MDAGQISSPGQIITLTYELHSINLCKQHAARASSVATAPVVLEQKHMYVARTSNNRVIMACELYGCLLPRCKASRTCRSGFPIASAARYRTILVNLIIIFLKLKEANFVATSNQWK